MLGIFSMLEMEEGGRPEESTESSQQGKSRKPWRTADSSAFLPESTLPLPLPLPLPTGSITSFYTPHLHPPPIGHFGSPHSASSVHTHCTTMNTS